MKTLQLQTKIWMIFTCFILTISLGFSQATTFDMQHLNGSLGGVCSVEAADMDGDGSMDVIACGYSSGDIVWWKNNGGEPQTWERHTIDAQFTDAFFVRCADVDGDGDMDAVAASWNQNTVAWWSNDNGDVLQWSKHVVDSDFTSAHEVHLVDIDADGDVDILAAGAGNNQIALWRNNGDTPVTWSKQVIDDSFAGARSVVAGDMNNDGLLDIIGAAYSAANVAWWQNNGDGTWSKHVVDGSFAGSHQVVVDDIDGDGKNDIVAAAYSAADIAWWKNEGGDPVQWTKKVLDGNFNGALDVYTGDINGDGHVDILGTAQNDNDIAIWFNDGNADISWNKQTINGDYSGSWPVYVADVDGDHDMDIIGGATFASSVDVWINDLYKVKVGADFRSGHAPLNVAFTDLTITDFIPTQWTWDFDNDGNIDSEVQNPEYTFTQPGSYSVTVTFSDGVNTLQKTFENFINVFDGESALAFQFNDDHAVEVAPADINLISAFTFEAVIQPEGWGSINTFGEGRIFNKEVIDVYLNKNNVAAWKAHSLIVAIKTADGNISKMITPDSSIVLNEWQHVAVSYDSALSEVNVYINGQSQELATLYTGTPSGNLFSNQDVPVIIGNNMNYNRAFQGTIDEVRLWNTCRSEAQINENMRQSLAGDESGLSAYWPLNEGNGLVCADHSPSENMLDCSNAAWRQGVHLDQVAAIEDHPYLNDPVVVGFFLQQNYPNPFNPSTAISFELPERVNASLIIYNALGQKIRTLWNGSLNPGAKTVVWKGENDAGIEMPGGVYLCRFKAGNFIQSRKMLYLK